VEDDSESEVDGSDVIPLIDRVLDLYETAGTDRVTALKSVLGVGPETDEAWVERLRRTAIELEGDRPAP
jgi:hypothetical protein